MTPTDKSGREIKVGDFIVYGHNLGRCAGLRYGKVLAITELPEDQYHNQPHNKYHYRVIGVDDDHFWSSAVHLNKREGTLQFGDRMLVVHPGVIPADVLELLEGYKS